MSADTDGPGQRDAPVSISLFLGEDGEQWVARDEETGVTTQGPNRQSALENLDEAVAGYYGAGEEPTDEELRELGIEPESNTSRSRSESDIFR